MIVKRCLQCNGEFKTYPSEIKGGRGRFCSLSCSRTFSNKRGLVVYKGLCHPGARGEKNYNWKGGRILTGDGYWRVYKPDHPNASRRYVLEHRLIWEETNGKRLPSGWIVHHLNGIKTDNRPENLTAMKRSGHTRIEMGELLKQRIRELEEQLRGNGNG